MCCISMFVVLESTSTSGADVLVLPDTVILYILLSFLCSNTLSCCLVSTWSPLGNVKSNVPSLFILWNLLISLHHLSLQALQMYLLSSGILFIYTQSLYPFILVFSCALNAMVAYIKFHHTALHICSVILVVSNLCSIQKLGL